MPPLPKGRFGASRLVRWCAAQQNWDRIHFDQAFARASGLRERVINGALKQHLLVQFLERAFEDAWIWRLDFSFLAPDWVDESLEVRGAVRNIRRVGSLELLGIDIEIRNLDQAAANTRASAIVVIETWGRPLVALPDADLPAELMLEDRIASAGESVPPEAGAALGSLIEVAQSNYPLDLSRLRLFADALGDCPAWQFDPVAGAASVHCGVRAPPLFPIHAIELAPGSRPLLESAAATGREGSSEVGRNLAAHLGLASSAPLNGGSSVEIHSLLAPGERVRAESRLAGLSTKQSKRRGGGLLIVESLNEYRVVNTGRLLMRERARALHPG